MGHNLGFPLNYDDLYFLFSCYNFKCLDIFHILISQIIWLLKYESQCVFSKLLCKIMNHYYLFLQIAFSQKHKSREHHLAWFN